jgi:two-component system chemotaxis sensor kinase CheA
MSIDLSQFIPTFLEESFEGIELMEASLLTLEQGDVETINAIFRAAHSVKGGAGTFGFNHVTEFTHLVETLLDEMRDGRRDITQKDIEILLNAVDCMRILIEAIRDEGSYDESKIAATSKLLATTLNDGALLNERIDENILESSIENANEEATSADIESGLARWSISFIPEHHLVQTGNDPLLLLNAVRELGEMSVLANCNSIPSLTEFDGTELYMSWDINLLTAASEEDITEIFEWVEDDCQLTISKDEPIDKQSSEVTEMTNGVVSEPVKEAGLPASKIVENIVAENPKVAINTHAQKPKPESSSIRVGVDKVDSLINLVGELVITQSMLSELGCDFELSKAERLNAGLEQLLQNTKELQESVMRIRMLPISFAFNRFPRLIHDLSKKMGKEIELLISGEQTELDKTVMEQIGDPLVHLVRNAVDHGIEATDVRLANGKPEKGTVSLDAYHQGGSIVIEIKDDGGGIDRNIILTKAIEKGLVDESSTLTDSQVYDLLFEPGFSTAKELSDISGRGVGMDVVKRNIQSLGGRIQIESELGVGSKFKVFLPLTLAILDGQLVKVGREVYIIPLITIVESLQTQEALINRTSGDMVLYRLREDNVPVIPIYKLFNIPAKNKEIKNSLLVVVEADGQKIGLMVDDLLAQQQVVVKSLNENYQQVEGVSGATILGDGSVAMILDVPSMITMALKLAKKQQQNNVTAEEVIC